MNKLYHRVVSLVLCIAMALTMLGNAPGLMLLSRADDGTEGAVEVNLLEGSNPSFEEFDGNNKPTGWTISQGVCSNEVATDGTYSLKMVNSSELTEQWLDISLDTTNIEAKKTYQATIDVYGAIAIWLYLEYYDAAGQELGSNLTKFAGLQSEWNMVQVTLTAPEGTASARIRSRVRTGADVTFYYDNARLIESEPVAPHPVIEDTVYDELQNPSFDKMTEDGFVANWYPWNLPAHSAYTEDAFDGSQALRVYSDIPGRGVMSSYFKVTPGLTYTATAMYKEGDYTVGQIYIRFLDKFGNPCGNNYWLTRYNSDLAPGEWGPVSVSSLAFENAAYAQIVLLNPSTVGTVVWDDIKITSKVSTYEDSTINWKIQEEGHPRLLFKSSELETYRAFAKDETVIPYGYSGKSAFDAVLAEADRFVEQDETGEPYHSASGYDWSLKPLVDYNTITDGRDNTAFIEQVRKRMEYLALAYAITEDETYGRIAVRYAMDLCEWSYLGPVAENKTSSKPFDTPFRELVLGMSIVYDMCFDLLTPEQQEKFETVMITKAIEPLRKNVGGRIFKTGYTQYSAALLTACCAIIDEDNLNELSGHMNHCYNYIAWYLDEMANRKDVEGYSYLSVMAEEMVECLGQLSRVTGVNNLINHTFFDDVLVPWVVNFISPMSVTLPPYEDSQAVKGYFGMTMSVLCKETGNGLAGYYLQQMGGATEAYDKFIYASAKPTITEPEGTVFNIQPYGYGALRTGWMDDDLLLTLLANESIMNHSQYEQNVFLLASKGSWLASDPGYAHTTNGDDHTDFYRRYGHNTIFVDGVAQSVKGAGSLKTVFDNSLYGYLVGSAPGAYGFDGNTAKLNQFDRHAIMINHEASPYYVLFDDLSSDKERIYGWNLNTSGWARLLVDGKESETGTAVTGNSFAMEKDGQMLYADFAGKTPLSAVPDFYKTKFGPTLMINSPSAKDYQFMSVLSVGEGTDFTAFAPMCKEWSVAPERIEEGKLSWSTHVSTGLNVMRTVAIGSESAILFRGEKDGDWCSFPFTVEEDGTYTVKMNMGAASAYGSSKFYIDGQPLGETFVASEHSSSLRTVTFKLGDMKLSAGEHTLKLEWKVNDQLAADKQKLIVAVTGITLESTAGLQKNVSIVENYDDENVLGALVSYAEGFHDLILFNRGEKTITAGGATTDGKQASVLGLSNGKITEGYAATNATRLTYDGKALFQSEQALNIVADKAGWQIATETAQTVKLNLGAGDYIVKVDGKVVDHEKDGDIAALALSAGEHVVTAEAFTNGPAQTGDNAYVALILTTMVLAMAALVLITTKAKVR